MLTALTYITSKFIFNKDDIVAYVGNERNAVAMLYNYHKKGIIANIRRNLYCICNLATKLPEANKMQIASAITPTACISYHSAMEFHGFAHQVFNEMQVSSKTKFNDFEFDGIHYKQYPQNQVIGIRNSSLDSRIRVTDIERTIIDCVNYINLCGGTEELIRCLQVIPYVDENKLLTYLKTFKNKSLYKKVGYFLETYCPNLRLTTDFYDICQKQGENIVSYLTEEHKNCTFCSKWKLYLPQSITTYNEIESYDII